MNQYEIPLSTLPAQKMDIILGGQEATIEVYMRGDNYYFDLYINGTPIYQGLICRVGNELNPYPYRGFKGSIKFINVDNDGDKLDFNQFGNKYYLIYEG